MASALSTVIQFPSPAHGADESHQYLVFFIPGNPGPVAYYEMFLSYLHSALNSGSSSNAKVRFEVFGRSLSAEDDDSIAGDKRPNSASAMAGEIELMERALLDRVAALTAENKRRPPPKVIMIGHCSGAYIALELIKKLQAKRPGAKGNRFNLAGTVCLFPSVSMKTVAGTISQAVLSTLSNSALLVHASVKCLLFLVPSETIEGLLRTITGISGNTAKVTSEMIGSKWGIYQALTLWRNQMEDKQKGRWDDAIFNSNSVSGAPTYMLFGQNNDEPTMGRGHGRLEPIAGIHKSELPDYFFTSQPSSASAAKLVQEYVEEIVRID